MSSIILGTTNADYHANKSHLSSSALKTLLKSPEQFYQEYILGIKDREEKDVFTEGSLVHALILEPHKVAEDYAIFSGLRKQGKLWEQFKQDNPNKACISAPQILRAEKLVKAYQALPAATSLLKDTLPEHNMIADLQGVSVKARADAIQVNDGYIVDIKTTSMPSDVDFFKNTIIDYSYQLSAALYCDIAEATYGKKFDFYWLVLSKDDQECHIYKASERRLSEGRAMYVQALTVYKRCLATGIWQSNVRRELQEVANYEILTV